MSSQSLQLQLTTQVCIYLHSLKFKQLINTMSLSAGFSALHLAILKHRNECAKLLIAELGAKSVNALNESGVTSVHLAASAGK